MYSQPSTFRWIILAGVLLCACDGRTPTLVEPGPEPDRRADLAVKTMKAPPVAGPELTYQVSFVIENRGYALAPEGTVHRLLVSDDAVADPDDYVLASFEGTPLGPGAWVEHDTTVIVPSELPVGERHLLVLVDATNVVDESDDENNLSAAALTVAYRPDLITTDFSITLQRESDGRIRIMRTHRAANVGNAEHTADYRFAFYLSTDSIYSPESDIFFSTGSWNGFTREYWNESMGAADLIEPGDYYAFVVMDPEGEVLEIREDNNIVRSTTSLEPGS